MKRNDFLRSLIGASALSAIPGINLASNDELSHLLSSIGSDTYGSMFGFSANAIDQVRVGIIGMGNRGQTLVEMFKWLVENDRARVVALCDLDQDKCDKGVEKVKGWQKEKVNTYSGSDDAWHALCERDDIDLLLICTPWEWHTPMCLRGMQHGKHVASEVPIAYTLSDCWDLVLTAEQTQRHCIMIENCCYNGEELFVLNMIQQGVFGDITHTEGAYLHDLRAHMLSKDYYKDQWRLKHHVSRDGNFYTTHGLGPIAFYLDIGRGDTFDHLTSMSSRELNLSETAKKHGSPITEFKCGDINHTLIKTSKGKTILLQFDVHTGRPYSRINKVVGTKAVHDGYPSRLYIDSGELEYWGHRWVDDTEYSEYKTKYNHPIIDRLKSISEDYKQGHGGMDFVMIYRLITSLNLGIALDMNVYDGAMWSAVTPVSEMSVASNSLSLPFPDFTGGKWKEDQSLEIMRDFGS